MNRRKKDYAKEVARRIRERRGLGAGDGYRPWLDVRDARRGGIRHRVPSLFGDRNHHLLSNIELHWFQLWALCPGVVEIREQYPLFPRSRTQAIAADLGLSYPMYPDRCTPLVLTTDLVVFIRRKGKLLVRACAVKPARKLGESSVERTLEIERAYWNSFPNVRFLVLTDADVPRRLARAADWLYAARKQRFECPHNINEIVAVLKRFSREGHFDHACRRTDALFGAPVGTTMRLARQMAARRLIKTETGGLAVFDKINAGVRRDRRIALA